jgi:copper chaperone CopZ
MNTTISIPVKGMHCASCATTIEKTLKKAQGVISCEVNIGNDKAKLEFDPNVTNIKKLSSKIEPFGYSLQDSNAHSNHSTHSEHNEPVDHSMHGTHTMEDGTVMSDDEHQGMDHSAHL